MKKIPKEIYLQGNLRLNEKRTVIDARLNNLYSSFPAKEASPAGLPNNAIPLAAWIQERIDEEDIIITHPEPECDCEVELECTSTTCSFELPTFPPSVIYHYDLNIEDAVWTGDDATTARVVIKSGEEELLNIFYTGNFSCNDPCPNNYIQELLERVLQIYYGSIEGPTDYFTVILADNILLISSDTLKTFELSIIIGENTLDYTINNDSAFHTTTFSSEYVPAIELSESWSEFEDQYKLIWTINYTGEFQLSTTQNDITTVTHFTNISPVLSSGSCEDMTYELRHENVLIEEGEMVKTEITETKSICEAIEEAKYCTKSIPGSCDYRVEGIDLVGEILCNYSLQGINANGLWLKYTFVDTITYENSWNVNGYGYICLTIQQIGINDNYFLSGEDLDTMSSISGTTHTINTNNIISYFYSQYLLNSNPDKPLMMIEDNTMYFKYSGVGRFETNRLRIENKSIIRNPSNLIDWFSVETLSTNVSYSGSTPNYLSFFWSPQIIGVELFINVNGNYEKVLFDENYYWESLNSIDNITDYYFYNLGTSQIIEEGTVSASCEVGNPKTFEVNINGQWEDETNNVSEEGTWSLSNTTDIVTEWRYRDSEGNPGEPTPIVGDCTEPIEEKYSICEKLNDHEERIIELEENGGGSGSTYLAKNGIYIDSDTIKLGGNITEDTDIPNPDNKSFRVGNPGDAINLNANIPIEFGDFALTYTGFDYVSGTHQSFSGILKGVTFAPSDMEDIDIVGTFTIAGDPFNVTTPDGQIFIDGIWYNEGEVVMNKVVLNFTTSGISINANTHSKTEQFSYYSGNNGILNRGLSGNNNSIIDYIEGENGKLNRGITNPTTSKLFYETITDTKQKITVDNIELNTNLEVSGDVKLSGVTTGIPINTYGIDASGKVVKFNLADYLPKTLVEFRGSASYTGTTSESVVYASPAIPSTAWRVNGNYILTILGVCQAAQTQNAVIKIYLNTANTLNGSEILINQSHVLTDSTYTPNGGNVLAINLPIFKNTIELLTNKGNSTIANINTGSIFSSNINMTYAKTRTKVTPNFTGNLYLIITTTQSAVSVTTEINNIIFKEI